MQPRHETIHQLFEAQANARPDAVAVVCGAEQATYRHLDAQATRIARLLQRSVGRAAPSPAGSAADDREAIAFRSASSRTTAPRNACRRGASSAVVTRARAPESSRT